MASDQDATMRSGWYYFCTGFRMMGHPAVRRFVVLPLLVNVVLFAVAFYWLFHRFGTWIPALMSYVPVFLQWLNYLLWPLAVVLVLLIFSYFFSTLANWIAAPFNGVLAEQCEARLAGMTAPDTGVLDVIKDVPRIIRREVRKLLWFLPRALLLLVVSLIPVAGHILSPLLWFLFAGWMLTIQYCDYPFDNHKVPFDDMCVLLRKKPLRNLQFGVLVNLFTMIPLLNMVIMPAAVCGATAMWVDCYRDKYVR